MEYKPDSICKQCQCACDFNYHKCHYTYLLGNYWKGAKSGRVGLSKDGWSCKYFIEKKNKV